MHTIRHLLGIEDGVIKVGFEDGTCVRYTPSRAQSKAVSVLPKGEGLVLADGTIVSAQTIYNLKLRSDYI